MQARVTRTDRLTRVPRGASWPLAVFLLLALGLAGAIPAAAQETVIGFFEGLPGDQNAATGASGLTGWVLATSGVQRVVVEVDGAEVGQAIYGIQRPDVKNQYPFFVDSEGPGFTYRLNTTDFPNGIHQVSVKVVTNAGTERVLDDVYSVYFNNNTSILRPFGEILFPLRNALLYGTCDLSSPNRLYTPVQGFAVDLGVEIGDTGIGYVELLIDGVPIIEFTKPALDEPLWFNSRIGCYYDIRKGGLTNCYGLPNLRAERLYPFALDAPNAGYRFVVDIGYQIAARGLAEGQHILTIRSGDVSNQVENIDEIPVDFFCIENLPNQGSIGFIESPKEGFLYGDELLIQGWVVDFEGIDEISVFIDGVFVGNAAYGVDSRPGVALQYMGYPNAGAPVFRLLFDSTLLSDGPHQVEVIAVDEAGFETSIGERSFVVENDQIGP